MQTLGGGVVSFLIIASVLVFSSCSKEFESAEKNKEKINEKVLVQDLTQPNVENGILTIPTGDAYLSLSKQLSVMSETERIEWAKKKGFVSLLSKQVYVFNELQSCVTTEDVYALEKKYSQFRDNIRRKR